jgi:20S proteasome alpha/beta subunit
LGKNTIDKGLEMEQPTFAVSADNQTCGLGGTQIIRWSVPMSQVIACPSRAIAFQEEFDMTFTVALLGQNSAVVGADRRLLMFEPDTNECGIRPSQQSDVMKIYESDDRTVVCCYAGGPNAEPIARIIANESHPDGLKELDWRTELETLANRVPPSGDWRILSEVMCVRTGDRLAMTITQLGQTAAYALPITSQRCAGDRFSLARFIPKHFWRNDMPVEYLQTIARLSVAAAHRENSTGIGGGCDLATITNGDVSLAHYSDDENEKLLQQFDKRVREVITQLS